jgi:bifunctional non-homologous end joining protein LigD
VPKGPSPDPARKRLAVRTEDHPLAYAGFEGRIPKGQYGGGAVLVWDAGPYAVPGHAAGEEQEAAVREGLERGRLRVRLHGAKLQGAYLLVRTERQGGDDGQEQEQWLLRKEADEAAQDAVDPLRAEPWSLRSGLWIEDVS